MNRKEVIKMEKLDYNVVALSLGFTTTVLYVICLALVAITPIPVMVSFVNALQHSIDVSGIVTKSISATRIIFGIVGWFIIAATTGYIFTFLYNWLGQKFSS